MQQALILCLDSASSVCSVSLARGEETLYTCTPAQGMQAASRLHMMIAEAIEATDIDFKDLHAIALSSGPGSYTGLRIAYSSAKGLCFACNLPMIAVPTTLQAAYQAAVECKAEYYIAMIDARRDEAYVAVYNRFFIELEAPKPVVVNEKWIEYCEQNYTGSIYCGDAANKVLPFLENNIEVLQSRVKFLRSNAEFLKYPALRKFGKSEFEDLFSAVPDYLKAPNITSSKKSFFS